MMIDKIRSLRGKRLLLLGGSVWKEAIVQFANEQEIILIATGSDSSAGIFEIAEECYHVNSTDCEAVKRLIAEKKIDGVYMGGSEPVISAASSYLNELNMPCYCTHEQWNSLQNKHLFKKLCVENGLPVVPEYHINPRNMKESIPEQEYPVVTKPSDGCGSMGFSVCHNADELRQGYDCAVKASPTGGVIVEKYVNNQSVGVFYTFSNGEMHFAGLEDKYPVKYKAQGSYVAGLFLFESRFSTEFREKFENKIKAVFDRVGIKEGSVWIEVFHAGEDYYFNEVGYRCGGSVSIYPVDYFYGINQVAADIYYALTGESRLKGFRSLIDASVARGKYYGIYPVHLNAGKIEKIIGMEELMKLPNVVTVPVTKKLGDKIASSGTFAQVYALVHFVFDTDEALKKTVDLVHKILYIKDENGHNMVNRMMEIQDAVIKLCAPIPQTGGL